MTSLLLHVSLIVILFLQMPTPAIATTTPTCSLLVSEAHFDLEDQREQERLAKIKLTAEQAIFELLEPLWEAHSIDRLRYLEAKYSRDRARLSVNRATITADRAAAKLDVLTKDCEFTEPDRQELPDEFEALGCELVRKRKDMAALNLAYRKEVLESTDQLRRLELATAQELIQAQYALDLAKSRIRSRASRLAECAEKTPTN